MSKHDSAIKNWLSHNARFADIFNNVLFEGRNKIKEDELCDLRNESDLVLKSKNNTDKTFNRYRDVIKLWKNSIYLVILASEIQEKIHYAMPVRNMVYDGLAYTDQIRKIWEQLDESEKKQVSREEFLAHFRKSDVILPIITIVFYYGDAPWDGALELHQMFGALADEPWVKKYVPNYQINLIEPLQVQNVDNFHSDLNVVLPLLQLKNDKKKLVDYVNNHSQYFGSINTEDMFAISALLGAEKIMQKVINSDKEEQGMCKALQDLYDEGVEVGIEEGIELGRSDEKISIAKGLIGLLDDQVIAEKTGLPLEKVKELHI